MKSWQCDASISLCCVLLCAWRLRMALLPGTCLKSASLHAMVCVDASASHFRPGTLACHKIVETGLVRSNVKDLCAQGIRALEMTNRGCTADITDIVTDHDLATGLYLELLYDVYVKSMSSKAHARLVRLLHTEGALSARFVDALCFAVDGGARISERIISRLRNVVSSASLCAQQSQGAHQCRPHDLMRSDPVVLSDGALLGQCPTVIMCRIGEI